jgi:hypothetical protein
MALLGSAMTFSDLQPKKADASIIITLSGISIAFSAEQLLKAPYPILVMLSGITIEVRPLSLQQRQAGIDFTLLPNVKFLILLKLAKGG